MATTTNFGWETPDDTDLVKDGAAAIRTALGGVDTSFVDLKGGTTGQVLSKASNTDLDFSWITSSSQSNFSLQNAGGTALTGASTITVSGISNANQIYVLVLGASSVNANSDILIRVNGVASSTYMTTNIRYDSNSTYAATNILGTGYTTDNGFYIGYLSNNAASTASGYAKIDGAATSGLKMAQYSGSGDAGGGSGHKAFIGGGQVSTTAITSVSVVSSSGNFDAGTVYVYKSA